MKILLKRALVLALTGLVLIVNVQPQSSQTGDHQQFSGHAKKNADAFKESTDVVVAVFTALGSPGADAPGEADYDKAEIQVVSGLKSSLSGKLQVFYTVFLMPGRDQESSPVLGTQYIMFIQKLGPTEYEIKKLLPVTDDNVAKVKALITAAPAGK